ncbi:unnamed protein product [Mytilus edulis]|uniref:Myb/SANT-like DNA-binding domain-containing protein n=1 Tax=Mytilus edulis TaxID=6550 RepID=A0A8S3TDM7_MYTED|nr:unnamed protein product [Mytilus edulis]
MADLPSASACNQSNVKKTRERKPNFSEAEINLLQDEVEKNYAVINDKFGSSLTNKRKTAVWGRISMMVSSLRRNLQIPSYDIFKNQLPKLQNYVTNSKYFVHNGKAGEKMRFTDNFSLFNWLKLPENEKQSHKLQDCSTCLTTHGSISSLHKSYSHASSLVQPCKDLVNNINEIIVSPSSSIGKKTVQNVIKVLEPIIETQFNINFKKTLADVMNMSPRESAVEKTTKL